MASIDIKAMTSLVSAIDNAVGNLPYDQWGLSSILGQVDVDSSPASGLGKVNAWMSGAVPGLKRRLALAQAIEAQHPSLHGVVPDDAQFEAQLSTLNPTEAQNRGAADAKKLVDTHGKLDAKLIAEINKYKNDPYFAAGFANAASPTDLANVVLQASRQRDSITNYGPYDPKSLSDWQQAYGDLLDAVGSTVGTATNNTGTLALPDDYAKQWADTITVGSTKPGGDDRVYYGQAAAASLLLRYGTFSTGFLDTVSSSVYDYERANGKHGQVWGPRSQINDSYAGPYLPDGTHITDPLANIMQALGHNPQAAQDFFDVGGDGKKTEFEINGQNVQVNDRLKYLVLDRTWSPDKGSDSGDGLGNALQAATTYFRDQSNNGRISATIASQTFALIGSYTGHGKSDGGLFGIGSHQGWKMWTGMRDSVANIVASYAPDLIRMEGGRTPAKNPFDGSWLANGDEDNSLFPPNGPIGAWLNDEFMKKVLGTLGEDPNNLDIVTAGVTAAGKLTLTYGVQQALKNDPNAAVDIITAHENVPGINGPAESLANTLSFVITNGYQGDRDNQEFQKKRAENLSKALGIALSLPALDLPEGHEWTGFLIDQAKDVALEKIGEGPDQDAKGTYNASASDNQTKLTELTLNTLLANGYFDRSVYAKANTKDAPDKFRSPFDSRYAGAVRKSEDGQWEFDYGSKGYRDWVEAGQEPDGWLEQWVIGQFRKDFPAFGG